MRRMQCLNDITIRYTGLPFSVFKNLLVKNDANELANYVKDYFSEELLTSSKDLYNSLFKDQKFNDSLYKSLIKYLIRSSTRTTPYGILSGVVNCEFNSKTNLTLNSNKKKVIPDMEWLYGVIKDTEIELGKEVNYSLNKNAIYITNTKTELFWTSAIKDENGSKYNINYTNAIKLIINFCSNEFHNEYEIINILKSKYSNVPVEVFQKTIKVLVNKEYLISDFREILINNDQYESFIKTLRKYNNDVLINKHVYIQNLLIEYNNKTDIGSGNLLYKKIIFEMGKIFSCKNFLNIYMYNDATLMVEDNLRKKIEEYAEFLNSFNNVVDNFKSFKNAFLERYGNSAVQIKDLFENENLVSMLSNDNEKNFDFENELSRYLQSKTNGNSVKLNEFKSELGETKMFSDQELAFFIVKEEDESIKLITSPLIGSSNVYKTRGRFDTLMLEKTNLDSALTRGVKEVELCFIPQYKRHANVSNCITYRKFICEISTNSYLNKIDKINLDDIYLFVRANKIYFLQKSTGEELEFFTNHMLNTVFYPPIFKFMIDATRSNYQDPFCLNRYIKQIFKNSDHIPEISYKEVIIYSESWRLNPFYFNIKKSKDKKLFSKNLYHYVQQHQIPRYVFIEEGDNRILLDLESEVHIDILFDLYKKNNDILLVKSYFTNDNLLINDLNNNYYIGEFVFSCKSKQKREIKKFNIPYFNYSVIKDNTFLPFSNIVYLKLDVKIKYQNEIIINYIKPFVDNMIKDNILEKFFFIRYRENKDQLRLRFWCNAQKYNEFLEELFIFEKKIFLFDFYIKCSYDSYEREFYRYGKQENINFIEKYFCEESMIIIKLMNPSFLSLVDFSFEEMYIFSVIDMLHFIIPNTEEILFLLLDFKIDKKNREQINKFNIDKSYINQNYDCAKFLINHCNGIRLKNILNDYLQCYSVIKQKIENNTLEKSILLSLMHMRFNRLVGINRDDEKIINGFIESIVYKRHMRNKYEKK